VHLPHGAPKPHQISIKNTCPPKEKELKNQGQNTGESGDTSDTNTGESGDTTNPEPEKVEPTDFTLFYSLIVATNGKTLDLISTGDDRGEGAVCNGATLGKRDSLFPLPASSS
jgi:hypothetical protein